VSSQHDVMTSTERTGSATLVVNDDAFEKRKLEHQLRIGLSVNLGFVEQQGQLLITVIILCTITSINIHVHGI